MKVKYSDNFRQLVLDGENYLIIPNKKSKACINIDSNSIDRMVEKHGVTLRFQNFYFSGNKPTIKEKFKMILRILTL